MEPYVSVIMPAKNEEKYIAEAIKSIQNQTHKYWELLIIDDKSADDTKKIARRYAEMDSRIKIIDGDGICSGNARNKAIKIADGEYIVNMDADDISSPMRIEKLVERAKGMLNPVVGSDIVITDDMLNPIKRSNYPQKDKNIRAGFKRKFNRLTIMPGVILIKTEVLRKYMYREFYKVLVDWDLILRLGENPDIEFSNVKESLYYYRRNTGSMTINAKKRIDYNLLLRYNERQRKCGKREIVSLEEFQCYISDKISTRILYKALYIMKVMQHKIRVRKRKVYKTKTEEKRYQ